MPKSRNGKNHKERLLKRKKTIKQKKENLNKARRELINSIINSEKERGLFDNNEFYDGNLNKTMSVPLDSTDSLVVDNNIIIDGPNI